MGLVTVANLSNLNRSSKTQVEAEFSSTIDRDVEAIGGYEQGSLC